MCVSDGLKSSSALGSGRRIGQGGFEPRASSAKASSLSPKRYPSTTHRAERTSASPLSRPPASCLQPSTDTRPRKESLSIARPALSGSVDPNPHLDESLPSPDQAFSLPPNTSSSSSSSSFLSNQLKEACRCTLTTTTSTGRRRPSSQLANRVRRAAGQTLTACSTRPTPRTRRATSRGPRWKPRRTSTRKGSLTTLPSASFSLASVTAAPRFG